MNCPLCDALELYRKYNTNGKWLCGTYRIDGRLYESTVCQARQLLKARRDKLLPTPANLAEDTE